jgi:copper chaperone CopZ
MENTLRLVSNLDGLHCFSCINRITSKLQSIGANKVDIDIAQKIMKVDFVGKENDAETYLDAVKALGYKVKKIVVFNPNVLNNL